MKTFLFVLAATVFEASGDAIIRIAIHGHSSPWRGMLFLGGAALLALYGTSLNLAPVEFASVTGLYVALLIVTFQTANYFFFHTPPTAAVLAGGSLIVMGGMIIYFWR